MKIRVSILALALCLALGAVNAAFAADCEGKAATGRVYDCVQAFIPSSMTIPWQAGEYEIQVDVDSNFCNYNLNDNQSWINAPCP